jgi:hypothetical protein
VQIVTLLAKEDQNEWFDDPISMIESLSSLSIFVDQLQADHNKNR